MAPLPPVSKTIKAAFNWHVDLNLKAESILHFKYTGGPPTSADLAAISLTLQSAFIGQFKTSFPALNAIGLVTCLDLDTTSGAQGTGGTVTAGTKVGNAMPAQVCFVFNHQIARRYRGGKPRTYLPLGVSGDLNSTGTWASALVTAQNANWAAFIAAALLATSGTTSLTNFVNVSYFNNKALRATPVTDVITGSFGRTRIGTQRRRAKTA